MAKNGLCHVEWTCSDLGRARAFLAEVFGWTFEPFGERYLMARLPGGISVGIEETDRMKPGGPPYVYVEVDSIEAALERVRNAGGRVRAPKAPVAEIGWFAHAEDSDGNVVGLFEPAR